MAVFDLFLSLFFSHRYFTPPARKSRNHWRTESQLQPPTPPVIASPIPSTPSPREERMMGKEWGRRRKERRRRGEEPTSDPFSSLNRPNSATSCLRPPALLLLLLLLQRAERPGSSRRLSTHKAAPVLGLRSKPRPSHLSPACPASPSQRATERLSERSASDATFLTRSDVRQQTTDRHGNGTSNSFSEAFTLCKRRPLMVSPANWLLVENLYILKLWREYSAVCDQVAH